MRLNLAIAPCKKILAIVFGKIACCFLNGHSIINLLGEKERYESFHNIGKRRCMGTSPSLLLQDLHITK